MCISQEKAGLGSLVLQSVTSLLIGAYMCLNGPRSLTMGTGGRSYLIPFGDRGEKNQFQVKKTHVMFIIGFWTSYSKKKFNCRLIFRGQEKDGSNLTCIP